MKAQPIFLQTFGKSSGRRSASPRSCRRPSSVRTGRIASLAPGRRSPFTIAWRKPAAPARIEYDGGWVPIP